MKKVILTTALVLTLSVGTPAFAEESGTTATAEQDMVVKTSTTTEGQETPASEASTTAEGQETPASETSTTTEGQETPASETSTTTEGQETPASETSTNTEGQEPTPETSAPTNESGEVPSGAVTSENAGTTPDSFFYTFDLLIEDIKLLLTFNPEKEAELLLEFAQERLAEAMAMTQAEKTEFVEKAMTDYLALLQQAEEKVTEVILDSEVTEEVKTELADGLEKTVEVTETVTEQLPTDQKVELEGKIDQAYLVAQVVANLDVEVVTSLREQDFGYGQIAKIISLAKVTGKSVEEIASLLGEKADFGQVMKELGVNIHQVKQQLVVEKMSSVEAALVSAKANGTEKSVAKLEKKLDNLNKKSEKLLAKAGKSESAEENEDATDVVTSETLVEDQSQVEVEVGTEVTTKSEGSVGESAPAVISSVGKNNSAKAANKTNEKDSKPSAGKFEQKRVTNAEDKKEDKRVDKKEEKKVDKKEKAEAKNKTEKQATDGAKKQEKAKHEDKTKVETTNDEVAEVIETEVTVEEKVVIEKPKQADNKGHDKGKGEDENKGKGNKDENKGKGGK